MRQCSYILTIKNILRLRSLNFVVLVSLFLQFSFLRAEWVIWDGSTSTDFEVGSNWSTGSIPTNNTTSDVARFTSVPSNMPSLTSNRSIYGMDFTVGGVTVNGNYDLTFGIDGIDSSGSGTNVVNFNPLLSGTWQTWDINSGNNLTINGNLKGTATQLVFKSTTGGTVNLNGSNNTYSSKLLLRGNNNQRITAYITGATNSLSEVKVGDKDNTTDNGKATLNLTGSSASIETSGNFTVADRFEGIMNISSGADLEVNGNTTLANMSGANGSLYLTGSGSTFTQSGGQLRVGYNDNTTGSLTVSNSASVLTSTRTTNIGTLSGSTGTLLVESGGTFTGDRVQIANNAGSTGGVTITGSGSTLTSDNKIYVGNNGTGTMTISNSADVTSTDETIIASSNSATGTLTLTGSGSTLTAQGNLKVGSSGTGTLNIADSAVLTVNNNREINVATASGSTGTLNVDSNSAIHGVKIYVGNQGTGTMTVSGSADVNLSSFTTIASTSSSTGTLTVTGSGSTYTSQSIRVGSSGTGTLNIADSAVVTVTNNQNSFVGTNAGSTGTLNVNSGATLNLAKIYVGNSGTGTMTVSGSSDVTSSSQLIIGSASDGTGTVNVTGSGSTFTLQNSLKVGVSGTATLNVADSAVVTVANNKDSYVGQSNGSDGTFNILSGATYNANKIFIGNQSGSSGEMTVSGSGTVVNASDRIQIGVNGGGGTKSELHIDSNAVVNDTSTYGTKLWTGGVLEFNGGTLNSNSSFGNATGTTIRGDGTLNVNTGTFYLNGVVFDGSAGETLHISGQISNGGTSSATLTKNGAGTLKLNQDNTFSRAVNVNAGILKIEHEDALGESSNNNANTTTTVASGATLALSNSSAMTVYENLVISGTGTGGAGAIDIVDGSHTISGTVTLAGNSTIDVSSSDDTLILNKVVSGSSNALFKTGAGSLTLSNNNNYSGNTTVSQGTLNLSGSIDGNLLIAGGNVTGGTNANAVAGALTTFSSGTISPNTTGTRGLFNIKSSGTSTWTGGTYIWDVSGGMGSSGTDSDSNGYYEANGASDGTLYDILAFSGALDFSGSSANSITIDVNSYGAYTGYHWETPTEIKIATAASISNFNEAFFNIDSSGFNDATGAWWLDWGITSHGNALWLTYNAVPETSTWVMILTLPLLILLKFLHYKKIQKKISSED